MAINISNAFVTLFDAEVKQAYQGAAQLRDTVRLRSGASSNTVKFPKIGKGVATARIPQTDVTPLNVTYSQVTATMSDYNAAEYSDIFHQAKVNFDERRELVEVVSKAVARRQDQLIIDALNGSSTSLTVAKTVVTSGSAAASNLNVGKMIEAKKLLDANNVPSEDRCLVIHANNVAGLLADERAISNDFAVKALLNGEVTAMLGFRIIVVGDRSEGGLPLSTNDRTVFAFHKSAMGMAEGMGIKTEINYVPEKTSFLVNSMFSAGAVAIDDEGIVKITCDES
jgi:N4-gp56 family major capsid protein|tara:strand:+ start:2120 stop:2968 length:849 start_codon:yes stop_codon:yes gene_type:complete